jgi:hypothetical protein
MSQGEAAISNSRSDCKPPVADLRKVELMPNFPLKRRQNTEPNATIAVPCNLADLGHRCFINYTYRLSKPDFNFLYSALQQSRPSSEQKRRRRAIIRRLMDL